MSWIAVIPLGLLIGLALGSLGAGGSILTIPALVYVIGMNAHQATAGSLVVVGLTAASSAVAHYREGNVRLAQGIGFGALGIVGSNLGSRLSARMDPQTLLLAFSGLMLVVAVIMLRRALRTQSAGGAGAATTARSTEAPTSTSGFGGRGVMALVVTASMVGLLTGFFGVGGGFAVVPALTLALGLGMKEAVGTSLVVIAINCVSAFTSRLAIGVNLDWPVLLAFSLVAVVGSLVGTRLVRGMDPRILTLTFAVMLVLVAIYMGYQSLPSS